MRKPRSRSSWLRRKEVSAYLVRVRVRVRGRGRVRVRGRGRVAPEEVSAYLLRTLPSTSRLYTASQACASHLGGVRVRVRG